jgi:hypothetical protein
MKTKKLPTLMEFPEYRAAVEKLDAFRRDEGALVVKLGDSTERDLSEDARIEAEAQALVNGQKYEEKRDDLKLHVRRLRIVRFAIQLQLKRVEEARKDASRTILELATPDHKVLVKAVGALLEQFTLAVETEAQFRGTVKALGIAGELPYANVPVEMPRYWLNLWPAEMKRLQYVD